MTISLPRSVFLLFILTSRTSATILGDTDEDCVDEAPQGTRQCQRWASEGECDSNPEFMHDNCQKSCGICGDDSFVNFDATSECVDLAAGGEIQCREWAWHGECEKNPEFMHDQCRKSCNLCESNLLEPNVCKDHFEKCTEWAGDGLCIGNWQAKRGENSVNSAFVIEFCPKSCEVCDVYLDDRDVSNLNIGLPQTAPDISDKVVYNKVRSQVAETRRYVQSLSPSLQEACKMAHPNCARFALSTDCEDNEDHDIMKYMCAASCQRCERFFDVRERKKAEQAWILALMGYENSMEDNNNHKKEE